MTQPDTRDPDETALTELAYVRIAPEHAEALEELERISFPTVAPAELTTVATILMQCDRFPEGGFVVLDGDTIIWYSGTDIVVHLDYRGKGIGRRLYELRKDLVRRHNRAGIIAGGVIPGFADHKHEMPADEYVRKVSAGELYDPTLSFQIANGFEARGAIAGYMKDEAVDDYAGFIVWHNPDHDPDALENDRVENE